MTSFVTKKETPEENLRVHLHWAHIHIENIDISPYHKISRVQSFIRQKYTSLFVKAQNRRVSCPPRGRQEGNYGQYGYTFKTVFSWKSCKVCTMMENTAARERSVPLSSTALV